MKRCISVLLALILLILACGCSGQPAQSAAAPSASGGAPVEATLSASAGGAESREGKKVYFAGPLFNQGEKDFNLRMAMTLEEFGYEVFLPQRDGIEAVLLEGKTEEELTEMIFAKDLGELLKADIIFMNLDGRAPDEGACVELGIGYANGKRCYGFKTDTRAVEMNLEVNPMITGCMIKLFKNYDGNALIEELKEYLANNEL